MPRRPQVAQMHALNAKGLSSPWGGPKGKVGRRRQAAGRGLKGQATEWGWGGGPVGRAGLPRQGGARSPAWFLNRPKAAGGPVCPRLGLAGRRCFLPWRRPLSAGLRTHVGGGLCQMLSLSRWPRETPSPGLCLNAASDKEGSGLSGRTGSVPSLSGDPEPGVRLRALRGSETSLAPASLKAERTPRAPGSCPQCRRARVSALRAASRPGFEESGGQQGTGNAWARRPSSCGGDSAPRRTARPKDVCTTRSRDPGDDQELSRHFPDERNQALSIKTKPKQVSGCKCVAGHPFPTWYGVALPFSMNWQCVYVNILINREKSKSDLRYLGTPTPRGRGEKKRCVGKQSILLVLGVNDYCQR